MEQLLMDAFAEAERLAKGFEKVGIVGFGVAELRDQDGCLKQAVPFANLVTTAGDQYYAQKAITAISPANASAPTAANGMKLGTSATAAAKSGVNAAIVGSYISGSNLAFDATYPQASAVGGDGGWNAIYKTTWAAGTATNATINEVVMVNDQASNLTSSAANTYARAVLSSTVNKTATDTLAITWTHKFLGA